MPPINTPSSGAPLPPPRGLLGWALALCYGWVAWWHNLLVRRSLKAGLDGAEETLNTLFRESLAITQRALNGASAWTLSVFNRDYKAQLRGRWTVLQEQYSWWGQTDTGRSSTLNAVLARNDAAAGGADAGGAIPATAQSHAAAAAAAPAGAASSQDGLRHRKPANAAAAGSRTQAPAADRQQQTAGLSEIEPLPDMPAQHHHQHQQRRHQQQQHQRAQHTHHGPAGQQQDDAGSVGGSQWWGQRIADEATEAAAAAQEAATAAVQQAASTMSQAVEEAAATAAAWARSMRAVFVEPPAGWGVHEAIKQTGLLEDVSLHGQLFISRMFDRLRWLLGKLTFSTLSNNTPTAAVAAARQRSRWGGSGSSILQQAAAGGGGGGGPRMGVGSSRLSSSRSSAASTAAGPVAASPAAAAPAAPGLFSRFRRPAVHAAAGAVTGAAGGVEGGRRFKLRSFTSVDLPSTHRLSLDGDDGSDDGGDQRRHTAAAHYDADDDDSGLSDASSAAYDSAVEDAVSSSQASCSSRTSSTSSFAVMQHAAGAGAGAGLVAATASTAAADLADLAGPPLTVRVPHSALSSSGNGGAGSNIGSGSKAGHGRVSFADAAQQLQQQQQSGAGAVGGLVGDATPFATLHVQQLHQGDISSAAGTLPQLQQHQQHARPGSTLVSNKSSGGGSGSSSSRRRQHKQLHGVVPEGMGAGVLPGRGRQRLQRSHSGPAVSVLRDVSSAGQVIRMAGYPLEVHEVVTPDGYLLRMERIPQPTSTDAVFMMHGVLDTSLTWVAGGITGSQAFAAWDRGFDVWLGTSRSNPPHEAADPSRRGSRYWVYSHNEVGVNDMGAQIDHIHATKMRELTALGRRRSSSIKGVSSSGRRPSGRASGSSVSVSAGAAGSGRRQRPVPEHADILEGVVDADVLVGIRPLSSSQGYHAAGAEGVVAASPAGDASKPPLHAGAADQAPGGDGHVQQQQHHEPDLFPDDRTAGSFTPDFGTCSSSSSGDGASRPGAAADMSRAASAVEIDQAAAAEAAAAFRSHRAAMAAAGVHPNASSSRAAAAVPDSQQQQQAQQPEQQSSRSVTPQLLQDVLAPLTPTAAAAAAAASRAATAFGSAVASAAVAAGGMIGIASASGAVEVEGGSSAAAGGSGSITSRGLGGGAGAEAGFGRAAGRRHSSTSGVVAAVTAKPGASGLLERLLGGTVPVSASGAVGAGHQSPVGGLLQPQGSGMRHVSSAPDIAAVLAELQDEGGTDMEQAGNSSSGGSSGADGGSNSEQGPDGFAAAASGSGGGVDVADSSSRHARRSSCPSIGPICESAAAATSGPDGCEPVAQQGAGSKSVKQQHQEQQPEQPTLPSAQQPLCVSPFSQQQPRQQHLPSPALQQQQLQQEPPRRPPSRPDAAASTASAASAASASAASAAPATQSSSVGAGSRVVRSSSWGVEPRPYNLRVVCHSLGGLLLLIYCTQRARVGRPHHVSRLILLSPAGFHPVIPSLFKPLVYIWRPIMLYTQLVWRQQGFPVHLPTFVARMLAFKLSVDTSKLPAVGDLLRNMARLLLGGDRSAWDRALLMPHYTAAGMPLLSSRQVLHFIQLYLTGRCQLFDYGSEAANVAEYQQRVPPVVSDAYHMLRDVPVHLVAGEHDGVIAASNIRCHYAAMKAAGMDVSYREFDYGHMDFTFSAKEELGWYVMSLLMRT